MCSLLFFILFYFVFFFIYLFFFYLFILFFCFCFTSVFGVRFWLKLWHFLIIAFVYHFIKSVVLVNCLLTHISLASFSWDIVKQQSPRYGAGERGVPSRAILFAKSNFIENLNKNKKKSLLTPLKRNVDSSK